MVLAWSDACRVVGAKVNELEKMSPSAASAEELCCHKPGVVELAVWAVLKVGENSPKSVGDQPAKAAEDTLLLEKESGATSQVSAVGLVATTLNDSVALAELSCAWAALASARHSVAADMCKRNFKEILPVVTESGAIAMCEKLRGWCPTHLTAACQPLCPEVLLTAQGASTARPIGGHGVWQAPWRVA